MKAIANKKMKTLLHAAMMTAICTSSYSFAEPTPRKGFTYGPVFSEFGQHAKVVQGVNQNQSETAFKVAFDVAVKSVEGKINRRFDSLARFINMNVANGTPPENIELALIVHGKATLDLLKDNENPNQALLEELMKNNVKVILCGQSAAAYGVSPEQLVPGVQMALSAMNAHAQLQMQGYTLNPF